MGLLTEAEEVLSWMALGKSHRGDVPLAFFDGAEPLHMSWLKVASGSVGEVLVAEQLSPAPGKGLGQFDVSSIGEIAGDDYVARRQQLYMAHGYTGVPDAEMAALYSHGEQCKVPGLSLSRVRTVAAKHCRGRVSAVWPHMVEWTVGAIDQRARLMTNRMYIGFDGRRWKYASKEGKGSPFHETEALREVEFACAIAFARRYDWRVCLGYEDSVAISFVTDPIGAREVFRLRDVPEGRPRRAALRHWVEQHWRKKRDGDKTWVRSHLRGAMSFTWNGLRCRVVPSEYDLERLRLQDAAVERAS